MKREMTQTKKTKKMVINKDPNYRKPIVKTENEQKEAFLSELRKESVSIICLALMYAKNFEETGEDITKRMIIADKNADLLQKVYNKGYVEGIDKGRKLERERNKGSSQNTIGGRTNS